MHWFPTYMIRKRKQSRGLATYMYPRLVETEVVVSTPSSVGTAPDTSVLLSITDASIPGTEISCLLVKQVGAKCIGHKKDVSVGAKFGRRFLTNFVHFCRVSGFSEICA